jgi:hypothetical protein
MGVTLVPAKKKNLFLFPYFPIVAELQHTTFLELLDTYLP